MSLDLRDERQADRPAIAEVIAAAFEGEDEVRLVERLRRDGDVLVALVAVAVADDAVVGHILFSPLTVTRGAESIPAVALAPLAVAPGRQGEGIGTALVREGLACCQRAGMALVVVLGDPAYYRRFGFAAATARPLPVFAGLSTNGDTWPDSGPTTTAAFEALIGAGGGHPPVSRRYARMSR